MRRLPLLFAMLGACASSQGPDPWPSSGRGSQGEVIGHLDGEPVYLEEVGRYLRSRDPEAYARNVEAFLLARLTRQESKILGVTVPAPLLRVETRKRMAAWEARLRNASREGGEVGIEPELWLERVAGISLREFEESVAEHTEVELLQDRLLRHEQAAAATVEVSLIVVKEASAAESLLPQLRGGGDWGALARTHSLHESAREGGRVGFRILPEDVSDLAVRSALFESNHLPGAILGPFPSAPGDDAYLQIYRLEARHPGRAQPYATREAGIAADLEKRPVSVGEYERWRRRVLIRHGFAAAPTASQQPNG